MLAWLPRPLTRGRTFGTCRGLSKGSHVREWSRNPDLRAWARMRMLLFSRAQQPAHGWYGSGSRRYGPHGSDGRRRSSKGAQAMMPGRLKRLLISDGAKICDAMRAIEAGAAEIALVVDDEDRLIGALSDGDIRRPLL